MKKVQPDNAIPALGRLFPDNRFYGWAVTLACGMVMFVSVGIGFYVLSIFLHPLHEEHGWNEVAISGATTLYFSVSGLAAVLLGAAVDRIDPRRFIIVGIIGLGLCLSLIGQLNALWQLYVVYGVMAVCFAMSAQVPISTILTRWWVLKRAQAMSVAFTFISLGGLLFAPIGTWMIDTRGLDVAGPVLGLIAVVVALPFVLGVIVSEPSGLGLFADGADEPIDAAALAAKGMADQARIWTRKQAAGTAALWQITVGFLIVLTSQVGFLVHQVTFLAERHGTGTASFAVSFTAFGSAIARLAVGSVADKLDKRLLTVGLITVQGVAVLLLPHSSSLVTDMMIVLAFGFTMGNIFMMHSLLTAELFGMASFGTVFGLSAAITQVVSGLGPLLIGVIRSHNDSYDMAFTLTGALTLVAAVVIATLKAPPPATSED